MTISVADMAALELRINAKLTQHKASFVMSVHFTIDRLNDVRNDPPITVVELEDLLDRVIAQHMLSIVALNHLDTFNIRCLQSHINMPCAVKKSSSANGTATHKNIIITVMRKEKWYAKDAVDLHVA